MLDSKTENANLIKLAKEYQKNNTNIGLSKLNSAMLEYLNKKQLKGLTKTLSEFDKRWVITDVITKILLRINSYDLEELNFISIMVLTYKQSLMKHYNKFTVKHNKRFVSLDDIWYE